MKNRLLSLLIVGSCCYIMAKCKVTVNPENIGELLCNIKLKSFQGIYRLIFYFSYVAGLGVLVGGVFKLKQVKDNPTQIPVSTPIALFICGTLLLFLPSILNPVGESIFGSVSGTAYSIQGDTVVDEGSVNIPANLLDS